jgi:hypothetical protein
VSALEEMEATAWRALTEALSGPASPAQQAALVDGILAAAERYALARYGITADRRAELATAIGAITHWQKPGCGPRRAACHGKTTSAAVTPVRANVTCGACAQTHAWKEAA